MKKPKPGKLKVELNEIEIPEEGDIRVVVEVTDPPDRKGEVIEFVGFRLHEVDEIVLARSLCLQWLNDQGYVPVMIGAYIFHTEAENDPVYWHANFWIPTIQNIDTASLQADWELYWFQG